MTPEELEALRMQDDEAAHEILAAWMHEGDE